MTGIVYALVLMGCSDAGEQCQRLDQPIGRHASQEACMAAVEAALESPVALRADFPSVFASCEATRDSRKPTPLALLDSGDTRRR
jgi:hypothetical protein